MLFRDVKGFHNLIKAFSMVPALSAIRGGGDDDRRAALEEEGSGQ